MAATRPATPPPLAANKATMYQPAADVKASAPKPSKPLFVIGGRSTNYLPQIKKFFPGYTGPLLDLFDTVNPNDEIKGAPEVKEVDHLFLFFSIYDTRGSRGIEAEKLITRLKKQYPTIPVSLICTSSSGSGTDCFMIPLEDDAKVKTQIHGKDYFFLSFKGTELIESAAEDAENPKSNHKQLEASGLSTYLKPAPKPSSCVMM